MQRPRAPTACQIAAAAIGNALEWYDFIVYGYLTTVIAGLFFPPASGWGPILGTLAIFAVSFVIRPFGGALVGGLADHFGRRPVLLGTLATMTIATAIITATPTYASIGIAAPALLLLSRLLHGLAIGGEFAAATSFLAETAPAERRGYYAAWQFSGQGAAIALAGCITGALTAILSPAQVHAWGWRIPFACGLVAGPVGLYMRRLIDEPRSFAEARSREGHSPSSQHRQTAIPKVSRLLIGGGMVAGGTVSIYVLFVFMPTYAVRTLGLPPVVALGAPSIAGLVLSAACPVAGYISDFVGRKPLMVGATLLLLIALEPLFLWLQSNPTVGRLIAAEALFGLCVGTYLGGLAAAMIELFPILLRGTAISIAYNAGVTVFGGGAPYIVALFIAKTGNPLSPAYYVAAGLGVSLIAILSFRPDHS